jgi:hypothetical protein
LEDAMRKHAALCGTILMLLPSAFAQQPTTQPADSAAIQRQLDGMSKQGGVVRLEAKHYTIDKPVTIPQGVTLDTVYDRSDLIYRAIDTLKRTLIEESLIVAAVCFIFLLHVRSALVAIITLPLGVLIAYLCMHLLGLSSNIMSLGGSPSPSAPWSTPRS